MGSADVVPGVSGGTIAFITGIYETLLDSIKSVDRPAFRMLFQGKFRLFWSHINGSFLLTLFLGIALSVVTLARVIDFLLEEYPIQLWSFFFGLIIISAIMVSKEITRWNGRVVSGWLAGAVFAYFVTAATPATTPDSLFFIFISGAVAICAMILPGISGSFILLIFGKYEFIISAVKEMDLTVIAVFGLGCVLGLLSFARLVSWLLKHFHDIMVAVLAGFMIGSLNKIWPWKEVLTYHTDRHGKVVPLIEKNIMPTEYLAKTGESPEVLPALLFLALGVLLVVAIEKIARLRGDTKKFNP